MIYPQSLDTLIQELTKLPTVGIKSARRMAFSMLLHNQDSRALAKAIEKALQQLKPCAVCFALSDGSCNFCDNPKRDSELLCVVEDASNIFSIEQAHFYHGLYHVLEGALSPIKGITPEKIRIRELEKRCDTTQFHEVILATHPTIEGEATAHYIKTLLALRGIKFSRLAIGLPNGADLELIDPITLGKAFSGRSSL